MIIYPISANITSPYVIFQWKLEEIVLVQYSYQAIYFDS